MDTVSSFGGINSGNKNYSFQENKSGILKQIDKYDASMLSYLADLYDSINGEKIDFRKVKNAVNALALFNKKAEYNYLTNLMYPEKCKGVKIPSPIPVPSCSFQLHNCVTLTTNSSGNLAFIFNPFFLANNNSFAAPNHEVQVGINNIAYRLGETKYLSTLWKNNENSLDGHSTNASWYPINIGQSIPDVYDQYRLVSASIVVKYIGRLDIASGVIGGAILYDDNKYIGCRNEAIPLAGGNPEDRASLNPGLEKYGNFDLAMDSFYHQENMVIEGLRELYFPVDNSYEEYTKLANVDNISWEKSIATGQFVSEMPDADMYKSGFNFFVYVLGAPPSSACFKVDIYCNFECLPNASFLNYLPLSMNTDSISSTEKKNAISVIQNKPVMTLKDKFSTVTMPSIWEKLQNKFSNSLPGIGKLLSLGLRTMIPSLKPGLALAGTLINAKSMQENQLMEEDVD